MSSAVTLILSAFLGRPMHRHRAGKNANLCDSHIYLNIGGRESADDCLFYKSMNIISTS